MDRLPATSASRAHDQLVAGPPVDGPLAVGLSRLAVGRRDFLKRCGMAGLAVWGVALAGCESGRGITEVESRRGAFFADGTDFVD